VLPCAVYAARTHNVALHRRLMRHLMIGGCIVAGAFTLLPQRLLGHWLWHDLLGVI
jgi:uncharacterized membrane protein